MALSTYEIMELTNYSATTINKQKRALGIRGGLSQLEILVIDYIKSIYAGNIIVNSKKIIAPLELDIFIPEFNLGIELNGDYWHSTKQQTDKHYHMNKKQMCKEKGIALLSFYEHQIKNSFDIIKSVINNKLKQSKKIYARTCSLKEIKFKEAEVFLNENHIQGSSVSSINYALLFGDEIVCIMTFSKSRYAKNVDYELIRLATKVGCNVVGGASKLFAEFKKQHPSKSVVSYSDESYSNGDIYGILGFEYVGTTLGYFYVKNNVRYSRVSMQKHKLKDSEHYDISLSEEDIASKNGFLKIYDSGQSKFVYAP